MRGLLEATLDWLFGVIALSCLSSVIHDFEGWDTVLSCAG